MSRCRSRPTGAPAPICSPWCIVRSTRPPSACPAARSVLPGSASIRPSHTLGVELSPPEKVRPRGQLDIPVKLTGLEPGEEAYVTVAAVDVGILNLTELRGAEAATVFLRPAPDGRGGPRSLRLPDRRHAGREGRHPLGRRRGRRPQGGYADAASARALFGHREGGRGRHGARSPSTCRPSTARCASWPPPGRRRRWRMPPRT